MSSEIDLDKLARDLQEQILSDARKIFSEKVIELFLEPANVGELEEPDGSATYTGPCGDTMSIFLRTRDGRIEEASFVTDGCGPTIACGSLVTDLAKGKTVEEAMSLSPEEVLDRLGGLPESHVHCPTLVITTLRKALENLLTEGGR
jgi:nitrogen fixation NifU-like protein